MKLTTKKIPLKMEHKFESLTNVETLKIEKAEKT